MDSWSCIAARENAERNGVAHRVEIREGIVGPDFLPGAPAFDGILANIESGVLLPLLSGFRGGLREGGWLVLSGVLDHEVEELLREAEPLGFHLDGEEREDGWWSGAFRAGDPTGNPPAEG
jgi:ribosomal protein L11 methyltransferase